MKQKTTDDFDSELKYLIKQIYYVLNPKQDKNVRILSDRGKTNKLKTVTFYKAKVDSHLVERVSLIHNPFKNRLVNQIHVEVDNGNIVIKGSYFEYKFPPEMILRVMKGWNVKK